ncbi:MAG: sulfotransferase domain-containing protein [Pseudomonadota bacterium]
MTPSKSECLRSGAITLGASVMAKRAASAAEPRHLIIIGAMKCGTTTLFDILATHPEIAPARIKEPEYFSSDPAPQHEGVATYTDLWPDEAIQAGQYLLEASTGYSKDYTAKISAEQIRAAKIRPKLIYIVRDPIARIESQLNWGLYRPMFDPKVKIVGLGNSKYWQRLSPYADFHENGDLLLLDFDELKNDPDALTARVADFLELENTFDLESVSVSNKTLGPTVVEHLVYRNTILRKAFWNSPYRVRQKWKQLMRFGPKTDKMRLNASERAEAYGWLEEDIRKFGQTYRFDVGKWGF